GNTAYHILSRHRHSTLLRRILNRAARAIQAVPLLVRAVGEVEHNVTQVLFRAAGDGVIRVEGGLDEGGLAAAALAVVAHGVGYLRVEQMAGRPVAGDVEGERVGAGVAVVVQPGGKHAGILGRAPGDGV